MGNRHASNSIIKSLAEAVETHIIEYGVKTFTAGHRGAFDSMAIGVLTEAKERHNDIKLYLHLPLMH